MNSPSPEQLEHLVSAMLDGELPDQQQVELTRELLRNPGARRLYDQYVDLDRRAGQALRWLLDRPDHQAERPAHLPAQRKTADWAGFVTSGWAVAAAVLLMAGLWAAVELTTEPAADPAPMTTLGIGRMAAGPASAGGQAASIDMEAAWCETASVIQPADYQEPRPLIETPTADQRQLTRRVLGILDETNDCFYYLEMERQTSQFQRIEKEL